VSLGKLVAIVDDEQDFTTLFRDALKRVSGITVLSFTDSISALEHFHKNKDHYALVISDYIMPVLSGCELLKKVKEYGPNVRTALLSGFNLDGDSKVQQYVKNDIINLSLEKPIRIQKLHQIVDEQLTVSQVIKK